MRKYELSISADYVPEWGTTEAIREFFQNSIDEIDISFTAAPVSSAA